MTLLQKQIEFTRRVPLLISRAFELGFEVTLGDAFRDRRCSHWTPKTFHGKRLAIDINLFKNGEYLKATEDYTQLGEYWKALGGTWGGDFKSPDGNHYSWGE